MGIDHETVRVVGNIIGRNRVQLGLSMRDCEEIGKLVKAETGASMGLAYKTLQQREKPFKDKAEAQVGDVQKSLSLLLKYFPLRLGGDFPTIIITWDGYSPYSAFRSQLARKRLAVAATNGLEATNFLTVADKKKSTFHDWWVFTFLPQLSNVQERILRKGGFEFSLLYYKIGGDHAELASLFKGVGPGGHRSAFCATDLDDRLSALHNCTRLSLQEMDARGFECSIAGRFEQPCYTLTPMLHDTKGVMRLLIKTIPGARDVETKILGKQDGNMTGTQSRTILRSLIQENEGSKLILCQAMQGLYYFRYSDIPVRFFHTPNPNPNESRPYAKDYLFALLCYHLTVYLLEWANPGVTKSTYMHSVEHWFDEEDAHRVTVSDELFEHANGERKRWTACTSPNTMERDFLAFEIETKHGVPMSPLGPLTDALPALWEFDTLWLCKCITVVDETWKTACTNLVQRLQRAGLGKHIKRRTGWGQKFLSNPDDEGRVKKICVCKEPSWRVPPVVESKSEPEPESESEDAGEGYICTICTRLGTQTNFNTAHKLYCHYDANHRPSITCACRQECPICERNVSKRGFSQHLLCNHSEDISKKHCPICMDVFSSPRAVENHMYNMHGE